MRLSIFLFAVALLHGQQAATYDATRQVKLSGAVTRIEWVNPHAFVFVDVKDSSSAANWAVEIGSALDLERSGWSASTVHIGDTVNVDGIAARGTHRQAYAKTVTLQGKRIFAIAAPKSAAAKPEPGPRWPNGHPRLGPEPGKSGHWGTASVPALVQTGAGKIAMDADGLLTNIGDLDKVAPFQPWARGVYEYRQRTLLAEDPLKKCLPPGGPRQFQMPNGFQVLEQPELGRIFILLGGGDRNWRVIYTDGRPQGQPDEVVRGYYGNSVGKWEGDTLVVDVVGFNEHFWMTNGGLPHTEALHLIERYTRTDKNTLKYEVTVDDPRTYTKQWTGGWTMNWVPNEDLPEYFCEENAEQAFTR